MTLPERLLPFESPTKVLDHGFVRLVDVMGDDAAIAQAARVSYKDARKSKKPASTDRQLLRYLYQNRHTSPFEMAEIKLHCKMPIFVARQWIRHRTASVNEKSARYGEVPLEFYTPPLERMVTQSVKNKQGSGAPLSANMAEEALETIGDSAHYAGQNYRCLLGVYGLTRELARGVLPVNTYTEWYWKIDLHNLLHFLSLRAHSHAQWEIQQFANAILDIVKVWVPDTVESWEEYHPARGAHTFSATEMRHLRYLMRGPSDDPDNDPNDPENSGWEGVTARERQAFYKAAGL